MACGKKYYFLEEHSSVEQTDSIADYLPDDETFVAKNVSGTNTRSMLEIFGVQLKSFEEIANIFTNEMSPECADQLMSEWERMLGIPDDCFFVDGETLADRRRNALIKLAKMSVQTTEDFTILAEAFGITVTVQSGIDYVNAGGDPFPGGDTEARFTIVITFVNEDVETFTYTFPFTFGLEILRILECVFEKVRPANCNVLFIIDVPEVLGDFYFKLGEAATSLRNSYSGTAEGQLDSDISIGIGDTITFSYTANNGDPLDNENFIESADGVNFFGFATVGPSVGFSSFVGYTAILNGVAITSGDLIPYNDPVDYPVGGARDEHEIVLTATVATDVRFIGTANIGQPIYNVTIATSGQTWIYPIDSTSVTNADSNGSGNNLVISNNTFIIDYPVMRNTGADIGNLAPYFNPEATDFNQASNNFNYNAASMRTDNTGGALDTNGSTHWFGSIVEDIPIAYQNGFTIEVIARFVGSVNSNGRACGIISATSNVFTASLWVMGFDDYDGSAGGSGTITPNFSLLQRNNNYQTSASQVNNVVDLRGSAIVVNNIYHLLATIRPSDFSVEFWVNGSSVGSTTLSEAAFNAWAIPNGAGGSQDVLDGTFPTRFDIGARITNGAWRSGQDSHIQDLKVHLLEADDTFAQTQAANANFT